MQSVTYEIPIPWKDEKPSLHRKMATKLPNATLAYAGVAICFRWTFILCIVLPMLVCIRSVYVPGGVIICSHTVMVMRRRR